jgi:hypothetical protein
MALIPLVNGESYTWAQIIVNIGGVPIAGVKAIKYKTSQEKVNNYGSGSSPVSRGRGRKEVSASITLEMAEVEALRASSTTKDLLDIAPFDIIIAWLPTNGAIVRKTLKNCEFTEDLMESKEGDTTIDIELPLIVSHIINA